MSRDLAWLTATAAAISLATLGVVGLLAHLDEGRNASVIAFDILWVVAALVGASVTWRRTKWSRRT